MKPQNYWPTLPNLWGSKHRLASYAIAMVFSVAGSFLLAQLSLSFGEEPSLILFMLPIVLVAIPGGLGPGLLATAVVAVYAEFFLLPPIGSLEIKNTYDLLRCAALVVNGVVVSLLGESSIRSRRRESHRWQIEMESALIHVQSMVQLGHWSFDLASGIFTASEQAARNVGWSSSTLSWEDLLQVIHPEDREAVASAWQAALKGAPFNILHRTLVGGKSRWLRVMAEIEYDPNGKPVTAMGLSQDVTDMAVFTVIPYVDHPRIAAHLAILDQIAIHIGFQIDFHGFSAVRADDDERVLHLVVNAGPCWYAGFDRV